MHLGPLCCCLMIPVAAISAVPTQPPGLPASLTWDLDLINVESVSQTGAGVYIAVLDTGLAPNWRDYFPANRIAVQLAAGFEQPVTFRTSDWYPCGLVAEVGAMRQGAWIGSTGSTHGTHIVGTILGYPYFDPSDAVAGYPLPPLYVRGVAPDATIIPIKVLGDHQLPAMPSCGRAAAQNLVFGTDATVAAGIDYAVALALKGYRPMVINLSAGSLAMSAVLRDAVDRAIGAGVAVVAAAGNFPQRMSYPAAYAPVISVGSAGWTGEWRWPGGDSSYPLWWLQSALLPPDSGDVPESGVAGQVYVTEYSARALPDQQLDLLAPGSHVRGPYPGDPGYSHLPWWSNGASALVGANVGNFYFAGGTSMATPHVTSVVALMLEKNPTLSPAEIEDALKKTALPLPSAGSALVYEPGASAPRTVTWNAVGCDPVGAGLLQADRALNPAP